MQKKILVSIGVIVFVVIVLLVGYFVYRNFETPKKIEASNEFSFNAGDNYINVKKTLAEKGWVPVIPDSYENDSGTTPISKNPIDPVFPEISYCGSGVDAICTVDFKNGVNATHLDLQSKADSNGKYQWIVIGSD